ncbi:MAG: ABC transporter substrate-binding protein [Bradyrhizobium sp.]
MAYVRPERIQGGTSNAAARVIGLVGGAAIAWPLAARAQQSGRVRRIGILWATAEDDLAKLRLATFLQGLHELGWRDGENVRFDVRFASGNLANARQYAAELVALAPDVILAMGGSTMAGLREATRTVPVVFTIVADPVGTGLVNSLSRPGGNVTGFMLFEYSLCGKWLSLLKEIAPGTTRAAVLRDAEVTSGIGQFAVIQSVAPAVGVDVSPINMGDTAEMERAVEAFAGSANGGLIVAASALAQVHRKRFIALAARYKLPAVYYEPEFVAAGGLIAYGPNLLSEFRPAASYVDRILKGEKPRDLPVQAPNTYEMAVNLKTAKAIGLVVPQAVLAGAEKVIE